MRVNRGNKPNEWIEVVHWEGPTQKGIIKTNVGGLEMLAGSIGEALIRIKAPSS